MPWPSLPGVQAARKAPRCLHPSRAEGRTNRRTNVCLAGAPAEGGPRQSPHWGVIFFSSALTGDRRYQLPSNSAARWNHVAGAGAGAAFEAPDAQAAPWTSEIRSSGGGGGTSIF